MTENSNGLVHSLYHRLTREHPGEGARAFIRDLGWIGASFALAKVVSSLLNIAAGRLLGPAEYGKVNLFVSVGSMLAPFIMVGMNAAVVRYGVSPADRGRVFQTAAAVFLALAAATAAAVLLFRGTLGPLLGVPAGMLAFSLCYAVATGLFLLASAMQQASGNFSKRGLSEIAFSALLAAVFFAGLRVFGRTYEAMAYAYVAAFGCIGLFLLARNVPARGFSLLEKAKLRPLLQYGAYSFGGGLGAFLVLNVQALILNAFLAPEAVGQYAAYHTATIGVAAYLGHALATVLFPKASASTNSRRLWDLAASSWRRLAVPALLFFLAAEAAVLALMGRRQYGMQAELLFLFALCGTLMLAYGSLAQIVFSEGVKAARLSLFLAWGGGLVNFTACLALIPLFGVAGSALAFILTYTLLLAWLWKVKDAYLSGPEGRP